MKKRVMLSLFAGCVAVFGVAVAMDMNGPLGPGGGGINSDIGTNPPITTNNPSGSCCGHVVMRIVTNELSNLPHPDALCTGCCVRMRLDWYPGNGHCKNMIVEVKQVPMNPPAYAFGLGPDCDSATLTQFDFSTVCNTNGYTNFWVKGVHIADTNKIVASMYNCCGGLCSLCSEQPFPLPVVDLLSATGFPQVVPVDSNVTFTALMNPPGYGTNVVKWSGGGTPSEGTGLNFTTRWSSPGVHIVHARCGMAMDCGNFVNATATVIKVESIEPDPMTYLMEINDGDGDPKTRVFVVPISSVYPAEAVHVRAKILPNLAESQVPVGFGLIGGNGSERLSRTVERSSASESSKTIFTFFCGVVDSGLKTTVYVYDAKIGLYADGQIDPVGHSWAKIMMDYDSKQLISPIYQNYLTEIGFFPTNTAPWLGEDGILAGNSVPGDVRLDNAAFGSHFATGQKEYPIWFIPLRNALPQIHQMRTNPPDYNLFDFNCTDFAIMLGQLVGINTMDPAGISTPQAYAGWLNN